MTYKLDGGGCTWLPICTTGTCTWRGLPTVDTLNALAQAAAHEHYAHPGHHHARNSLYAAQRRTRRKASDTPKTTA